MFDKLHKLHKIHRLRAFRDERFGRGRGGPFGGGGFGGRGGPFGGGPFGQGGPFGEGGRKRQKRGDIRVVLLTLIAEQPRHGYELIKLVEERYGGFYRPSPGVIYPTLQLLEDEGHVTSETLEGKRVYTITESGRALAQEQEERAEPWEKGFGGKNHEQLHDLRHKAMALAESVMQVAKYGTPEQMNAVLAILTKASQDVHGVMAGGEPPRHV
jgi:DNA-binding PadR family transcriptional regulator